MKSGLVRWIAYMLLAALVVVTSCQAMADTRNGIGGGMAAAPSTAAAAAASAAQARH